MVSKQSRAQQAIAKIDGLYLKKINNVNHYINTPDMV